MKNKLRLRRTCAWLVGGALVAVSGQASAQTVAACPTGSTTVYISGSSAFTPVAQVIANVLGSAVNIVYLSPGSCEGLQHLLGDMGTAVAPDTDSAVVLTPNNTTNGVACQPPSAGVAVDVAASDVFAPTCTANFDSQLNAVSFTSGTAGTKDFLGPVQAMTIAVPNNSTEQVISADAAYIVFGWDATTLSVSPWTAPDDIFVRYDDSGTLEMIATAIGLPGSKWVNATPKGCTGSSSCMASQQAPKTSAMVSYIEAAAVKGTTDTNAAIGILGAANYGGSTLRPLAFQAKGQDCGWLPDSSGTRTDKINVRQGRYAIWGPEHLVVNVDGSGNAAGQNSNTAAVQMVLSALISTSQAPAAASDAGAGSGTSSLTDAQIGTIIDGISNPTKVGVVPQCAMEVAEAAEIGPQMSYAPPAACSCRFEIAAAGAAIPGHTCTTCTSNSGCSGSTPACRFGYCEAE